MKLTGAELRIAIAAYEAATDPAKWKDVLSELAQHCGATKAVLFTPVEGATRRFLWSDIGFDPAQLAVYGDHWVKEDAWILAHEEQHLYVAGNVQIGSAYLPWDKLTRTAFYNEFAVPAGLKSLITAILYDEKDTAITPPTHFSLFREPGEPEFERDHARFLRRMQPHLRKAIEVYWAFSKAQALPHAVQQTIDALPEPVLLLRANGFIEHANPAASRVISEPGLLRVKNGCVMGIAGNDRAWAEALHQAAAAEGSVLPFTHIRGSKVVSGVLRLAPIRENPGYRAAWPAAVVVAAVEFRDQAEQLTALKLLATHYLLTPTEVQVLQLLADGVNPNAIAELLDIRVSTVRSHLRSLFDKTGLRRQADLVRLIPR